MNITHIVLVEIDTDNSTIVLKTRDLKSIKLGNNSHTKYGKSFAICTNTKHLAVSIKSGIEALIVDDLINDYNGAIYNISALSKVVKGCNFYKSEIPSVEIIKNIKDLENIKIRDIDTYEGTIEFYDNYNLIITQIDELINNGAKFSKNSRKDQISIIHNRNLPILDQLNFDWVYNKDNNVVFDNTGLTRWRREGRFSEHRRLIEMKYFR